ncbi:uncharacterized protein AtWU_00129 [Aspergillus tubingensis]|uniref:uncharacterized protein n=1 Tax=Aspergillus tubingensis TaxID=5068 RepID=UPI0015781807|nr:uncharacterized protein AtWU_00129 [Aspergillus tubingensis]GFN10334.1 hypothetical protein AtWU_00129 [Aspergillus tubingensis]
MPGGHWATRYLNLGTTNKLVYPHHLHTLTLFKPRLLTPLSGGNVRSANSVSSIYFLTVYHGNKSSSLVNPGG